VDSSASGGGTQNITIRTEIRQRIDIHSDIQVAADGKKGGRDGSKGQFPVVRITADGFVDRVPIRGGRSGFQHVAFPVV
jgi:hypothetical protein